MIRLLYWLIKKRWAICVKCHYYEYQGIKFDGKCYSACKYYMHQPDFNYVKGFLPKAELTFCSLHNHEGVCWGFKEKEVGDG
jgi:hypothetical protein